MYIFLELSSILGSQKKNNLIKIGLDLLLLKITYNEKGHSSCHSDTPYQLIPIKNLLSI